MRTSFFTCNSFITSAKDGAGEGGPGEGRQWEARPREGEPGEDGPGEARPGECGLSEGGAGDRGAAEACCNLILSKSGLCKSCPLTSFFIKQDKNIKN